MSDEAPASVVVHAPRLCRDCGIKPARPGGTQCAACYQRVYRSDPVKGAARRAANRVSVKLYEKRHPEKRRVWVRNWQRRVGRFVPDLQALRRAIKRLDRTLQASEQRARV